MTGFAIIGLDNPKYPENVGSALRAAECYGVSMVAIEGERIKSRAICHATNVSQAQRKIPVLRGPLQSFIPYDCVPVAIELIEGAVPLTTFKHPPRAFYVFGAEDATLGARVLDWCPHKVFIPTSMCMNLAACVNVVLYDRMAKQ